MSEQVPVGVPAPAVQAGLTGRDIARYSGRGLLLAVAAFCIVWVLVLADNAAIHKPELFITTFLNAVTLSGLYFVVASGFTLIFGLMRVVNMAHGSFFLLAGYIAAEWQNDHEQWLVAAAVACAFVAFLGVGMQQALLRWNQGQDLRQALITIAVSVILADQMLAKYGGVPTDMTWPDSINRQVDLGIYHIEYPLTRLVILGVGIAVGLGLYLWLKRTRTGMVIRAGVDDRSMVSALGINIQRIFLLAFAIGSALAGLGGVLYANYGGLAPGKDSDFLLFSLIVVIIGGMGSLGGAAIGALLFGLVDILSDIYLPQDYTNYSVLLTFGLLVAVLAVRPLGLFGRPGMTLDTADATVAEPTAPGRNPTDLVVGGVVIAALVLMPFVASEYFLSAILTQALWLGIVAASLIYLAGYGGMVSLAQVAMLGIAAFTYGNLVQADGGIDAAWSPWVAIPAALAVCVIVGLLFGLVASRSEGIYFLMITLAFSVIVYLFWGQVTDLSGFGGLNDIDSPSIVDKPTTEPRGLYFVTVGVVIVVYLLLRYVARTPFGLTLQGIRDDPTRMRALGYNVVLHRTVAFGFAAFIAGLAGILDVWWNTRIDPNSINLGRTIDVLVIAVIGGLLRLEGAWIGAIVFVALDNYTRGSDLIGDRFNTVIGFIFLVIVLVSPGGIMGIYALVKDRLRRRPEAPVAPPPAATATEPGGT